MEKKRLEKAVQKLTTFQDVLAAIRQENHFSSSMSLHQAQEPLPVYWGLKLVRKRRSSDQHQTALQLYSQIISEHSRLYGQLDQQDLKWIYSVTSKTCPLRQWESLTLRKMQRTNTKGLQSPAWCCRGKISEDGAVQGRAGHQGKSVSSATITTADDWCVFLVSATQKGPGWTQIYKKPNWMKEGSNSRT